MTRASLAGDHEDGLAGACPPAQLPRLLPAGRGAGQVSLAAHLARYGSLPTPGPGGSARGKLMAEVYRSGLTGRGGAAFPTGRKLAAVAAGRDPVVVANGTEAEPGSAKDKVLLARSPHLVLDGLMLAAALLGARRVKIVVHHSVREIVDRAVAERSQARLDLLPVSVSTGADRFVGGEASAVLHWLDRGLAKPTPKPPRVYEHGLGGAPTLVQNVETLAHLALIARYGAAWFRSAGTGREPGSMLVTIVGVVRDPGVQEIGIGTEVTQVLGLTGGPSEPLQALLIGGFFGTWTDARQAAGLPFSAAGLASLSARPGAGLIAALPRGACGICETARVIRYLASESAGQCGPCLFGLDAVAGQVEQLASGRIRDTGLLRRWLSQVDRRGACSLPDGAAGLVRSALEVFKPELNQHAQGWCCGNSRVLPVLPRRPWP